MRTLGFVFTITLFLSGCLSGGEASKAINRFPIGLYSAGDAGFLETIRDAGFDTVETGVFPYEKQGAIALEARRLGMRIVAHPAPLRAGSVKLTSEWPVLAWYLQDEPDVNHLSAEWMERESQETRRWDPERAQTFVVGQGSAALTYGHVADAFMLDWYPVPHLPLDSVADHIDLAYSRLPKDKPLWMVVQAYDWRDEPVREGAKRLRGRFPSHHEIRFMSYLSIVHGARGLFYFTFRKPGGRNLLDYPEQWQALTRVVREIRDLQPVLEGGKEIAFPAALTPGVVEGKVWRYQGRSYAVVVNRSTSPAVLPSEFLDASWKPLFESRRNPQHLLKGKAGIWHMPRHRALVFEKRRR